jgi:hypothetical protein
MTAEDESIDVQFDCDFDDDRVLDALAKFLLALAEWKESKNG